MEEMNATSGTKTEIKDPICGMTVNASSKFHAERDGKTFYFCGDTCRQKFVSKQAGVKSEEKSKGCCG